jgi:hypothetical protein
MSTVEIDTQVQIPVPTPESLIRAGQRRINLIWESTQAIIAVSVLIGYILMMVKGRDVPRTYDALLVMIVTFYFARTNGHKTGGPGGDLVRNDR